MQRKSLIAGLGVDTKRQDLQLLTKIATTKPAAKVMRGNNITNIIEEIKIKVNKYLGKYADRVKSCRSEQELTEYIDKIIENKKAGLDTETTGLDCLNDDVVGTCLFTPGEKAIYVPHKHKSYITGQYLGNQISYDFMSAQLQRLADNDIKLIYHNAKFDMRMIKNRIGVNLGAYWDTMLAAKLLNNGEEASLKYQYSAHIAQEEKSYDFKKLFDSIEYAFVPIETATLYAATDALITYELQQWQEKEFEKYPGIYKVFRDIEMRVLPVVAQMEDNGVCLSSQRAQELSIKYHKLLDEAQQKVNECLKEHKSTILMYKSKFPAAKIDYPVNVASPSQLAILLYDILRCDVVDKKKPRGTGEEILEKIKLPICKAILEYRGVAKLLSTYIDKLPQVVDKTTGRIHASFNQIGADTGRFSSSEPNLQNIPSHNQEIRTMFTAAEGCVLIGSDFSQQEPKLLTYYTQDKAMLDAYAHNKDLYAQIASLSFHRKYDDCLEFYPEGTAIQYNGKEVVCGYKTHTNKEGKEYRNKSKQILLGIMYGRGAASIAEQLHCSTKEATDIINSFYKAFPTVKGWMDKTVEFARKNGYVETFYGRRRYIKNITLPDYEFSYVDNKPRNFNPLSFDLDDEYTDQVDSQDILKYTKLLNGCTRYAEKEGIKQRALAEGIKIHDNGGYLAEAIRQCVNSRIQGGAADQSKLAMINIDNCEELKKLGFKLLIGVHDELIGEAPFENAKRCGELLSKCMQDAAADILRLPAKCDVSITRCWYGEEVQV